jgi:hypothetical protein
MGTSRRVRTKKSRGADGIFGYIIPAFLVLLAGYQQVVEHNVDKYVLVSLVIFGLGALGWQIDSFFETWVRAKYSQAEADKTGDTK